MELFLLHCSGALNLLLFNQANKNNTRTTLERYAESRDSIDKSLKIAPEYFKLTYNRNIAPLKLKYREPESVYYEILTVSSGILSGIIVPTSTYLIDALILL